MGMLIIVFRQMIRDFLGGVCPPNFPSLTAQENRDCWLLVISDVGDFGWDFLAGFSQISPWLFFGEITLSRTLMLRFWGPVLLGHTTFEKAVNLGISSSIQQAEHHKLRESVSVPFGVGSLDSFIIP